MSASFGTGSIPVVQCAHLQNAVLETGVVRVRLLKVQVAWQGLVLVRQQHLDESCNSQWFMV